MRRLAPLQERRSANIKKIRCVSSERYYYITKRGICQGRKRKRGGNVTLPPLLLLPLTVPGGNAKNLLKHFICNSRISQTSFSPQPEQNAPSPLFVLPQFGQTKPADGSSARGLVNAKAAYKCRFIHVRDHYRNRFRGVLRRFAGDFRYRRFPTPERL